MTIEPNYSLDVYVNEGRKLVIAIRRQHPYTDADGVKHPGTAAGINVWFTKMRYARSGKESATISANTASSHALFFTSPDDWEQHLDYKSGTGYDDINYSRKAVATLYKKNGYTFVGNEDHKLGESVGLTRPKGKALKTKASDFTMSQIKQKINVMTEYSDVKLDESQMRALVKRCTYNVPDPIITVSDLFNAVCDEILFTQEFNKS